MPTNQNKQTLKIAIVDDHPVLNEGLKLILHSISNYSVIIQAGNGEELIKKIESTDVLPDICFVDISMPVMDGYQTLGHLKTWPEIKSIVLSTHYNEFTIINAFRNGACACLPKEVSIAEVQIALQNISDRGFYHTELTSRTLYDLAKDKSSIAKINKQEAEFLKLCCLDLSYNEIAKIMKVSNRTIDGYRDHLFEKLSVNSRTALVVFAIKAGLYKY